MQAPSASIIELALEQVANHDDFMENNSTLINAQTESLAEVVGVGKPVDFYMGFNLGLQTARLMMQMNVNRLL